MSQDLWLVPKNPIEVKCMHCGKVLVRLVLQGTLLLSGMAELFCPGCHNLTSFLSDHKLEVK